MTETNWLPTLGAGAFGVIIGWFVYFTNRYRKGNVQFSDITALVGAIGGGAILTLFEAKTDLFGAYGIGLFIGFFAYFIALIFLVKAAHPVFGWTWFLDGRRKRPADDEIIPEDIQPSVHPMALPQTQSSARVADVSAASHGRRETSPGLEGAKHLREALTAIGDARAELQAKVGATNDDAERAKLFEQINALVRKQDELTAIRLREIADSDAVKAALAKLESATQSLTDEAGRLKTAADAIATAARIIDGAAKVVGMLTGLFP